MKNSIQTFAALLLLISGSTIAHSAGIAGTNMSKSDLCDVAIKELKEMIKQSPDTANQPSISKNQCMAIPDEEINTAVQALMAGSAKK